MSHLQQHIQTAVKIIKDYYGDVPFASVLKQYFAANKKHGSKDRKFISQFCYAYFRLGRSLPPDFDVMQRMQIGIFLSEFSERLGELFEGEEKEMYAKALDERVAYAQQKYPTFNALEIFPFAAKLSKEIDAEKFSVSHLVQPDVFLRIRPNRKDIVLKSLEKQEINYTIEEDTVRFSSAVKADSAIQINRDAVVQDVSSQRVGEMFTPIKLYERVTVWDCCAASGGKSILAIDKLKSRSPHTKIELTVSDVRESIIQNLKKRFTEAGIGNYHSLIADLTKPISLTTVKKFDLIICDAPCSGSGTWGRTPEQLVFFPEQKIEYYATLQKTIALNARKYLQTTGYFLYITCSVLAEENEAVVNYLIDKGALQLAEMKYYKGYDQKADTLFAALFTASKP